VNLFKENETTHQADEESFIFGISQGVLTIRIEQAMEERKIPPLLNPLIDVDNNLIQRNLIQLLFTHQCNGS
jgi:hypothetical protein